MGSCEQSTSHPLGDINNSLAVPELLQRDRNLDAVGSLCSVEINVGAVRGHLDCFIFLNLFTVFRVEEVSF